VATPAVMNKFVATFNVYWEDAAFEDYDPDVDGERLAKALERAGRATRSGASPTINIDGREVTALPYQKDMLDQLTVEREVHHNHRNLLVAATGTGKTVMAALDYKNLCEKHDGRPLRLLFVAHREEILEQARSTYCEVMGDGDFGELHVGGSRAMWNNQLFASIQSFSRKKLTEFAPDHFDVIVIDEFHHGSADTYERLMAHFKATKEFLALTATPERSDGIHIQDLHFEGRIAAEMRLWEALESELLSPFHYFGIADETDLTGIEWKRGSGYDKGQLSNLYTGDDSRAQLIVDELVDKVLDTKSMRALGFCVSVDHAKYMANYLNDRGIYSAALDGESPEGERKDALEAFRNGELQALFSVDLFNEGLDVPDVDTLLMLRPTQSPTIFLQQLGRGLRRTPTKPVLTVLDFIGQHRREYHFAPRYKALTGLGSKRLLASVEADFPELPAGCRMILDKKSKKRIVENIRTQIDVNVKRLTEEVREAGTRELSAFLDHSGRELKELYKGSESSWTTLLRRGGLLTSDPSEAERALLKRMFTFLHADDERRVKAYTRILVDDAPSYDVLEGRDKAFARMLFFSLWPDGGGFSSYAEGLASLQPQHDFRSELRQVLAYNLEHTKTLPTYDKDLPGTLAVHAAYSREECLAALDAVDISGGPYPSVFREGVKWCKSVRTDALFVTLEKEEKDFSPETRYEDYALGPHHFHWQSQNNTSGTSETGKRYRNHKAQGSQVLLFVKRFKTNDIGRSHPTTLLGPVEYVRHEGSRPMSVVWKLRHELPADVLTYSSITHK
jgi:superfamily II DNA or RNA helicase